VVLEDPELTAAGEFGPHGVLPVWRKDFATSRRLSLFDVRARTLEEIETPMFDWGAPVWAGDLLLFIGEREGQPLVVRHQAGFTQTTPLALDLIGGLEIEQVSGSVAVVKSGSWAPVRFRVDLDTGELSSLQVDLPEGFTFAGRSSATLAEDGSLVIALRKNGVSGLYRSHDGKSWEPLGGGVAEATAIQFAGRSGTWLMTAAGALGWASATTLGVIPSMQRAVTLPPMVDALPSEEAVSLDGRCAAVWTGSGTSFSLVAVDLVRGTQRTLAQSAVRPTGLSWLR
jgi:hypothetical protein